MASSGAPSRDSVATAAARALWLGSAVLAIALTSSAATAATTADGRQCVDPCIQAARGAHEECTTSAVGTYRDTLDGCLERDATCVAACRYERQECRDATSLGSDLAVCEAELIAAKDRCHSEFRPGSIRHARCIDRARVEGFRCRRRARGTARRGLAACRNAFGSCTEACGPGGPLEGVQECTAEAKTGLDAARDACRTAFHTTTAGCLNRDITCVQECVAVLDGCAAAARAIVDDAFATCAAERNAGLAACRAANPDGGQALEDCETAVTADAFACREAALEAAAPSFEACGTSYEGCVLACPPA